MSILEKVGFDFMVVTFMRSYEVPTTEVSVGFFQVLDPETLSPDKKTT